MSQSLAYDEMLKLTELPSLVNRRLHEIAILLFKAKKNQLPSRIQELFTLKANCDRSYSLRNLDFNLRRFNTIKYGKHLLRYYGPFLWSKLTKELHAEDSLRRFKTKIRRTVLTALLEVGCKNCTLCNS